LSFVRTGQWPKNSHSKRITGIGTPSNHSKMPRPIVSSSTSIVKENASAQRWFRNVPRQDFGISESESPILNSGWPSRSLDGLAHFGVDVAGLAGCA
jgi:hypothetical protein